jgi:hypothetical protein
VPVDADKERAMYEVKGLGRAIFAAVFLMIAAVLNVIYGIAAISNSHFFAHNPHYVFADLKSWGWVTLILGVLEGLASLSLFSGRAFGRWFAIIAASLTAIAALLEIPSYPLWSIALFALSLWIIHGLIVYGESKREAEEAMRTPESPPATWSEPTTRG